MTYGTNNVIKVWIMWLRYKKHMIKVQLMWPKKWFKNTIKVQIMTKNILTKCIQSSSYK